MSIKDIYIPMFAANILASGIIHDSDQEKIQKALTYHNYVRQCWINHNKIKETDDVRTIDIQYEAANAYLNSHCEQFKSEIRSLSFQLLTDVVNWFHSNNIHFIVHDCHEYEVSSITPIQLEVLNGVITTKYGETIKFVPMI